MRPLNASAAIDGVDHSPDHFASDYYTGKKRFVQFHAEMQERRLTRRRATSLSRAEGELFNASRRLRSLTLLSARTLSHCSNKVKSEMMDTGEIYAILDKAYFVEDPDEADVLDRLPVLLDGCTSICRYRCKSRAIHHPYSPDHQRKNRCI